MFHFLASSRVFLGVIERIPGSACISSISGIFHVYVPENGAQKGQTIKFLFP